MDRPAHPVVFLRTHESFTGHGRPLVLPAVSSAFDFEGELVAMIGRGGRHIPADDAARHIAGYTAGNDGSIRDYQLKRGTQWTLGKNFDGSGALGPCFVTADELPPLARGLKLHTRLNGEVVQSSDTQILKVRWLVLGSNRRAPRISPRMMASERPSGSVIAATSGVGCMVPPLRTNSGSPKCARRRTSVWLSADWLTPSCSAALVMVPWVSTASKTSRKSRPLGI
jgi:hypothetical protein